MKHLGEEAGVAVRGRRANSRSGMPISAGDMVDRDIGDAVRRLGAGDRGAVRADQPARRAEPLGDLGAGRRRGDPGQPALEPACCAIQPVSFAAAAGRKLSRWISWMRGQVSWTGRPSLTARIAACSIASVSSLRP